MFGNATLSWKHLIEKLLSYLAQGVLADPCGSPRDAVESLRRKALVRSTTETRRRATVGAEQPLGEAKEGGIREGAKVPEEEKGFEERGREGEGKGEEEGEEEGEGEGKREGERERETAVEAAVEDDRSTRNGPASRASRSLPDAKRVHSSEGEAEEESLPTSPARNMQPQDEPPLTLPLPPPPLPPGTDLDPSDPYSTIRCCLLCVLGSQETSCMRALRISCAPLLRCLPLPLRSLYSSEHYWIQARGNPFTIHPWQQPPSQRRPRA